MDMFNTFVPIPPSKIDVDEVSREAINFQYVVKLSSLKLNSKVQEGEGFG
jgi:hypothetical protein